MIIRLNNKIYCRKAIKLALEDYKDICAGKIIDESFEVKLSPKQETKYLEKEFCNYIIGIMKNEKMI